MSTPAWSPIPGGGRARGVWTALEAGGPSSVSVEPAPVTSTWLTVSGLLTSVRQSAHDKFIIEKILSFVLNILTRSDFDKDFNQSIINYRLSIKLKSELSW